MENFRKQKINGMKIEIDEAMVEYYQVLAKQIKSSLPEPQI